MTEKELGKALLDLDASQLSATPDARQLTWKVLERDRRRVRWLSGLTISVWFLAAILILLILIAFGFLFPAQAHLRLDQKEGRLPATQRAQLEEDVRLAFQKSTVLIAFAVAILTLAALCTVALIFASRRATLRQVNASLVEISEQLKQLRQAQGK